MYKQNVLMMNKSAFIWTSLSSLHYNPIVPNSSDQGTLNEEEDTVQLTSLY